MAKQRGIRGYSELGELEAEEDDALGVSIEINEAETEEPMQRPTVFLVLLKDMVLTYVGPVTGRKYYFNRAGSTVEVDYEDAQIMLTRKRGAISCCGTRSSPYFDIVR